MLFGHALGRADLEDTRGASRAALVLGAGFMATAAIIMLAVPALLVRAYTTDGAVIALAAALIPIVVVFQIFDGLQVGLDRNSAWRGRHAHGVDREFAGF